MKQQKKLGKNKVVIFSGGVGERMKLSKPKQFIEFMGKPVIARTIARFQQNELVDEIVVVIKDGYVEYMQEIAKRFGFTKITSVITGGETAMDSTYLGLVESAKNMDEDDVVLIHDGVRPLIDDGLITKNIETCRVKGNSISVGKMIETPIIVEDGKIKNILNRENTLVAKAPQTFYLKDILDAHNQLRSNRELYSSFLDSCSLINYLGIDLHYVFSSSENIKITTKTDLYKFVGIMNARDYKQLLDSV